MFSKNDKAMIEKPSSPLNKEGQRQVNSYEQMTLIYLRLLSKSEPQIVYLKDLTDLLKGKDGVRPNGPSELKTIHTLLTNPLAVNPNLKKATIDSIKSTVRSCVESEVKYVNNELIENSSEKNPGSFKSPRSTRGG